MKLSLLLVSIPLLIFLCGCYADLQEHEPEIKTQFQCQDGSVVNSSITCQEYKCENIKCVNISIPYLENISYNYNYNFGIVSDETSANIETNDDGDLNYFTTQNTRVKNFENKIGAFTVTHSYRTLKEEKSKMITKSIPGGETEDFLSSYDNSFGEDIEVKTSVKTHSEDRNKQTIKYRQIQNCNSSKE